MTLVAETNIFCRRCGRGLYSEKAKAEGIGSGCKTIENREKIIKPYIWETKFVETAHVNDDGSVDYLARCYGDSSTREDSF